ncbi:FAD-binding domain-containing protein [Sistotremastrum suecicum HHB10207 ss-3]|uniref:FAD-binding domain-containing protein n=1 Tax=Sistotremastrum suecicum HHB10207 ss-3 TaxID=1314776 RepID=A0A166FZJ0_9AGAM|nr:FAD-binding domain-containing protein [Sistotremastrum suecicum HHB10207 ss-3]
MSQASDLKAVFNGDLVLPGDSDYTESIARWAKNAERKARYVTFPKDTEAVSAIVRWAVANKVPLAVKGGGHSASGASSSEDGLVIDLSRYLNQVTVSEDKQVLYVGGGALWKDVDQTGADNGVATPGGTVNHTGVGGLILGGGYGFLSGEHGLVVDNLVETTVVLADGRIVTASETSEPELFWALRGGGGNFGVVTQFVLKCYPQRPTVYAGLLIYSGDKLKEVVEVARRWHKTTSPKEGALLIATRGPGRQPVVIFNAFYNGTEAEGREKYKEFIAVGPIADHTGEVPITVINTFQNPVAVHGRYTYMTGTAQEEAKSEIAVAAFQKVIETSEDGTFDSAFGLEFFPHGKISSVPLDATAFPARKSQVGVLVMARWDADGTEYADTAKKITSAIKGIFVEGEGSHANPADTERGYSNYASDETLPTSTTKKLFQGNYPRLQKIKYQYDPSNVFNRWWGIEPVAA